MKNIDDVMRLPDESEDKYCQRLYLLKDTLHLTWMELAEIINEEFGHSFSPDKYRKDYTRHFQNQEYDMVEDTISDDISDIAALKMERVKLTDERNQVNAMYRRMAREETIVEMARIVAKEIDDKLNLNPPSKIKQNTEKDGILEISDWHFGIEIDNHWNKYNPDIAIERISKLRDEVISICKKEGITHLNVVNLGDLIAGRIHLPLRINSRFDSITQTIEVSYLLIQLLQDLSSVVTIDYYDTLDNHSRVEPNLKDSMELESLSRFTTEFIKLGAKFVNLHENTFGDDIITFETMGHRVVGVHGHKDKPTKIIDNMTTMTKQHYDIALTAHLHHFSCEEKNETVLVSNSSMMGTDDFAEKLRLSAKPSQNLIVVTKENPVSQIYKINLD